MIKEETLDRHSDLDESPNTYAEWKEANVLPHLHNIVGMTNLRIWRTDSWLPKVREGEGAGGRQVCV